MEPSNRCFFWRNTQANCSFPLPHFGKVQKKGFSYFALSFSLARQKKKSSFSVFFFPWQKNSEQLLVYFPFSMFVSKKIYNVPSMFPYLSRFRCHHQFLKRTSKKEKTLDPILGQKIAAISRTSCHITSDGSIACAFYYQGYQNARESLLGSIILHFLFK